MNFDFSKTKILVIGDIMLDKFTYGDVNRISPEAPVQVLHARKEVYSLGGASNVAANIHSLNGGCFLVGVAGDDYYSNVLTKLLEEKGIKAKVVVDSSRPTILKNRLYSMGQQLLRVDYEETDGVGLNHVEEILSILEEENFDLIIVSDYAKGLISEKLISRLKDLKVPLLVDPKPVNKELYKGVYLLTPNLKEAYEMSGFNNVGEAGFYLVKRYKANILITQASDGMTLFLKNGGVKHFSARAREVYDVSGAGDTVTAVLGLCLASKINLEESVNLANIAAGIVVGKLGTATVTVEELSREIN